jgi:uncharacterized membrane-anchored protein YjiN (DUF445 family)
MQNFIARIQATKTYNVVSEAQKAVLVDIEYAIEKAVTEVMATSFEAWLRRCENTSMLVRCVVKEIVQKIEEEKLAEAEELAQLCNGIEDMIEQQLQQEWEGNIFYHIG